MRSMDLTGQKFVRWIVLERVPQPTNPRQTWWKCRCICGNIGLVLTFNLRSGRSKGCVNCGHEVTKLPPGRASFNRIYSGYVKAARLRGHSWELSETQAQELFSKNCFYCGCSPHKTYKPTRANGSFTYNGIDRVDNAKGYTHDNCLTACETCNFMKSNLGFDEFIAHISRVYKNLEYKEDLSHA